MSELYSFLKKTTSHLGNVTHRTAYGLDAIFVKDKAFILVTKDNEIALRIEDLDFLAKRRESIELKQFELHNKPISHWYLVPTSFNKKKNRLIPLIDLSFDSLFNKKQKKKKISKKKRIKNNDLITERVSLENNSQKRGFLNRLASFFR